jgi:3-oxoacyl-(acyl-carrier-protein) synthase
MTGRPAPMAVTGFSLRTPLGDDVESITQRMLAGDSIAAPNARFDARTYPCQLAATIPTEPKPTKNRKFVKRMGLLGIEVGAEAFTQSKTLVRGPRLGLFCGYGGLRAHWDDLMPILERQDGSLDAHDSWAKGFSGLHPFWMLFHLSNNAHALLSIMIGATGDGTTTAGSNAGAQALRAAAAALEAGSVDAAIVFAYDSFVEPETILSLGMSGAATKESSASRVGAPYGDDAAGFVPSEAAAALVLEKPNDAAGRTIALISATMTADGNAGFAEPNTIAHALSTVAAGDTVVDGAGLAQRERDDAERSVIANVLGRDTTLVATTASLGQMGAATSLVQTILLSHFLSNRTLAPIAGLSKPSPGPLHPLVETQSTTARSAIALSCGMPGLVGAVRVELP